MSIPIFLNAAQPSTMTAKKVEPASLVQISSTNYNKDNYTNYVIPMTFLKIIWPGHDEENCAGSPN